MTELSDGLRATEAECAEGRTAPRISLDDIQANVAARYDFTAGAALAALGVPGHPALDLLTICLVVTQNGFSIIGKSAPASPANFDPALGVKLSYEDAVRQLWPLMGYELRERLSRAPIATDGQELRTAFAHEGPGPVAELDNGGPFPFCQTGLGIGGAIAAMRDGRRVARIGWNAKGTFLYLCPAASYPANRGAMTTYFGEGAMVPYREYLAYCDQHGMVSTWAPSVNDTLADDWAVLAE